MMPPLFLASNSPRRVSLLSHLGFQFTVLAPQNDEVNIEKGSNEEIVKIASENALQKALSVLPNVEKGIIIGGDTMVITDDNKVLGKPKTSEEALQMLQLLVGRTHRVISAIAIIDAATRETREGHTWTKVTFRNASEKTLKQYVLTGEPIGKAGGYAIQGKGAILVEAIEGSYTGVIGLPAEIVLSLLNEFGISSDQE